MIGEVRTGIPLILFFFFFNDTATTEIYTLSLHDALPISTGPCATACSRAASESGRSCVWKRSEEHTSELQSQSNLVCRLLLEKKKNPVSASCTLRTTPSARPIRSRSRLAERASSATAAAR